MTSLGAAGQSLEAKRAKGFGCQNVSHEFRMLMGLNGLQGLNLLLERIERHVEGVEWMKLSTIADLAIQAHRDTT